MPAWTAGGADLEKMEPECLWLDVLPHSKDMLRQSMYILTHWNHGVYVCRKKNHFPHMAFLMRYQALSWVLSPWHWTNWSNKMTPAELIYNASVRVTYHDAKLQVKEVAEGICYHFSGCLTSPVTVKQSEVAVSSGNTNNWKQDLRRACCNWAVEFFLCLEGCENKSQPLRRVWHFLHLFLITQCHRDEPYSLCAH